MLLFHAVLETEEERSLLETLYLEHRAEMFAYAKYYLKNDHDAEDVVQTVFLETAERHMRTITGRDGAAQKRFLMLGVKYRSLDVLKKRGRVIPMDDDTLEAVGGECSDEAFIETICGAEFADRLEEAIKKLAPIYRETLWLKLSLDMTSSQIAQMLGEKTSTIEKRVRRGKTILLSLLEPEGGAAQWR